MKLKEEILGSCSPKIGEQKMVKGKTMELEWEEEEEEEEKSSNV